MFADGSCIQRTAARATSRTGVSLSAVSGLGCGGEGEGAAGVRSMWIHELARE